MLEALKQELSAILEHIEDPEESLAFQHLIDVILLTLADLENPAVSDDSVREEEV